MQEFEDTLACPFNQAPDIEPLIFRGLHTRSANLLQGNAYLDASFPQLTRVVSATIVAAGGGGGGGKPEL